MSEFHKKALRARLNDEDHRVHTVCLLGGVTKHLVERRGTLTEHFTIDGDDVTQSITRLERAGMIDTKTLKWNISEPVADAVRAKVRKGLLR
jgi:endonuclease V-like protein UPF0215 family